MTEISAATESPPAIPADRKKAGTFKFGIGARGLTRLASLAITLLAWEWYGRSVDPIFLSYPTAILAAVPRMWARGEILPPFLISVVSLSIGLSLAIFLGVLLGLLMGRYRVMDNLLSLQLGALYSTPHIALIPLLILWFGLGLSSKVAIVFLSAFFPITINTYSGVRNVGRGMTEIALAEGAGELRIFMSIVCPASLPFIMTGIRLAMGRAVVGMVAGEMFTAVTGLGGAIVAYGNAYATDKLFVIIIMLSLMGISLTAAVAWLERWMAPWKETERAT